MNKEIFTLIKNYNIPFNAVSNHWFLVIIWILALVLIGLTLLTYTSGQNQYHTLIKDDAPDDIIRAYKQKLLPFKACIIIISLISMVAIGLTANFVVYNIDQNHKEKQWNQALSKTTINNAVKNEIKNHPLMFNHDVLTSYQNENTFQLNNLINFKYANTFANAPSSQMSVTDKQLTLHLSILPDSSYDVWPDSGTPGTLAGGFAKINVDLIIDVNNNVKIQPNDITSLQIARIEAYLKANNIKLNDKATKIKTTDTTTTVTSITSDQKIINIKANTSKVINIDIT